MSKTIFCVTSTEFQAESILNELRVAALQDSDFSILLADKTRAIVRGVTGTVATDTAVGWLPQVESITISSTGAFIASGLLATAVSEAAAGSHKGAIARALTGLGIDSEQAEIFEDKLRAGKVLLAVQTQTDEQAHIVHKVFDSAEAENIVATGEPTPVEAAPHLREEKWEKW